MTANELAARLNARPTSSGWEAHCPAHDDRNASLSIGTGAEGRVLLKCHAGCDLDAICATLGIRKHDLFSMEREQPAAGALGWNDPIGRDASPHPITPEKANCRTETVWRKPKRKKSRKRGRIVATYDYTDAGGKLIFQVCRMEPKDFRQRRPNPDKPGRWLWKLNGVPRVLYRLPDIAKAKDKGCPVYLAEGEKDCDALAALGLYATCNPGGAGKWRKAYTEALHGANVIVLPDKDTPGRKHAAAVLSAIAGKAQSVRVVELPDRDGQRVKDPADWIAAGGTVEDLAEIVRTAPAWKPPPKEETDVSTNTTAKKKHKPSVLLPAGPQTISATGHKLGKLLAETEQFFIRGGTVVKLGADPDGLPHLEDVKAATLASDFETVADLYKMTDKETKLATCPEQTAKLIAASTAFRNAMRPIYVLTRCPVVIERGKRLMQVSGYDRESGILAAGEPAETMDVAEARRLLFKLLDGFRFATPSDRARALAAMITPALVFGGLLKGRAPVDLGEADASQTGKGYRNKLTAALYAQSVKTVTQQRAGVGSMEESFNMALIRGANFIALDNVRGKIDSPSFESFLTEDTYLARAPYREPIEIDPRRVVVMLTSNKADVTTDLANRSTCVRLLKQPDGYAFKPYPEGDILEHVQANQSHYLGAVFAIIDAWYYAGKPHTTESRHDFRRWAQTLDWICQNLLGAGPLLDGHRETQARMTNPVLNWLRDVAIEVIRAKQAGAWLRASDLVDLLADTGTETPGLPEHGDPTDYETRKKAQQATGRKLSLCFRAGDVLTLDGMTIERREIYDPRNRLTVKEYVFQAASMDPKGIDATNNMNCNTKTSVSDTETPEFDFCVYSASSPASSPASKEVLCASNASNPPVKCEYLSENQQPHETREGDILPVLEPIDALDATPTQNATAIKYEEGEI